jgi:hypothetical protein
MKGDQTHGLMLASSEGPNSIGVSFPSLEDGIRSRELPLDDIPLASNITQIFNAAMLTGNFPAQWKVAKIILQLKPGKPLQRTYVLQADEPITHSIQSL